MKFVIFSSGLEPVYGFFQEFFLRLYSEQRFPGYSRSVPTRGTSTCALFAMSSCGFPEFLLMFLPTGDFPEIFGRIFSVTVVFPDFLLQGFHSEVPKNRNGLMSFSCLAKLHP